jgi:uncharacterized glyoxalase superfamily protein PhnB
MKKLTPNLMVDDVNRTVDFYRDVLGFELLASVPEEGALDWGMMKCGTVELMFQSRSSLGNDLPQLKNAIPPGPVLLYIDVESVQILRQQIEGKATLLKEIAVTFYGTKEFTIQDCNGFILTFAEGGN